MKKFFFEDNWWIFAGILLLTMYVGVLYYGIYIM